MLMHEEREMREKTEGKEERQTRLEDRCTGERQ